MLNPTADSEGDLRSLLLRAAREILSEPDTPFDLRKVAERAGKSRSAPYVAFGKTEEGGGFPALRLAVAAEGLSELANEMESALRRAPDPEAGLHDMAAAYLRWAQRHPRLFRLAFGPEVASDLRRRLPSPEADRDREALAGARRRLEGVIRDAIGNQAPGYLRGGSESDLQLVAGAIWAMLHGVAVLTLDEQWGLTHLMRSEDPRELAARTLRFLTFASSDALQDVARALAKAKAAKWEGKREVAEGDEGHFAVEEATEAYSLDAPDAPDALDMVPLSEIPSPPRTSTFRERPASYSPRSPSADSPALRRLRSQMELVEGARILWVDDRPRGVRHEREMLEGLGAKVTLARSTAEAAEALDRDGFSVIISDIERGGDGRAGIKAIGPLRELGGGIPLVLYVARLEPELPVPSGAFGITNDPEELLHLVLDALGRMRR